MSCFDLKHSILFWNSLFWFWTSSLILNTLLTLLKFTLYSFLVYAGSPSNLEHLFWFFGTLLWLEAPWFRTYILIWNSLFWFWTSSLILNTLLTLLKFTLCGFFGLCLIPSNLEHLFWFFETLFWLEEPWFRTYILIWSSLFWFRASILISKTLFWLGTP